MKKLYTYMMEEIFFYLHRKQYREVEKLILAFVHDAVRQNPNVAEKHEENYRLLKCIYEDFNEEYHTWIKEQGKDCEKEREKLKSEEHPNYLIAHCFDPASMDDLLFALKWYLQEVIDSQRKEVVIYQLDCYKQLIIH